MTDFQPQTPVHPSASHAATPIAPMTVDTTAELMEKILYEVKRVCLLYTSDAADE